MISDENTNLSNCALSEISGKLLKFQVPDFLTSPQGIDILFYMKFLNLPEISVKLQNNKTV